MLPSSLTLRPSSLPGPHYHYRCPRPSSSPPPPPSQPAPACFGSMGILRLAGSCSSPWAYLLTARSSCQASTVASRLALSCACRAEQGRAGQEGFGKQSRAAEKVGVGAHMRSRERRRESSRRGRLHWAVVKRCQLRPRALRLPTPAVTPSLRQPSCRWVGAKPLGPIHPPSGARQVRPPTPPAPR